MSTGTSPSRRTRADWEEIARQVLPQLQEGTPLSELRERYDITRLYYLRIELARLGYDLHGRPLKVKPVPGKRPAVAAKHLAERREAGEPYWLLEAETGMSSRQMQRLMDDHGYRGLARGRVTKDRQVHR